MEIPHEAGKENAWRAYKKILMAHIFLQWGK
jgi:hypothetical protein